MPVTLPNILQNGPTHPHDADEVMADFYALRDAYNAHTHAGSAGTDAPPVDFANIANKPESYPPSAHQHSGNDITSAVTSAVNADKVDGLDVTPSNTPGLRKITISTAPPSGGADGDVWIVYA